jgi:predicted RNA binding protein YcfA (HicA-like mRNA interferase family)
MPRLYSSDEIVKVLRKFGFDFVSQKGSHAKFKNPEGRTVIIPMNKKEIPIGTFRSIIKQSGLTQQDFTASYNK